MTKFIEQLREQVQQAEFQASLAGYLLIAAEHDKQVAESNLAAARAELQEAEEMRRGDHGA